MLSAAVGPLALSVHQWLGLLALAAALAAGGVAARRSGKRVSHLLIDAVLVGLVSARIGFVVRYLPQYRGDWLGIVDIRDGGFMAIPGVLGAGAFLGWWLWKAPARRRALATAIVTGALVWGTTAGSLSLIDATSRALPQAALATRDGDRVALDAWDGRPMVVNLWASWCPPCRREMPVLEAAQQRYEEIAFVFVNQGEGRRTVGRYLAAEDLELDNVLLDQRRAVGREVGAAGLPTTLVYDREGRLVDVHTGELSRASLHSVLERFGT